MNKLISALVLTLALAPVAALADPGLDAGIARLQAAWAEAKYRTPEPEQDAAFTRLGEEAKALAERYPGTAEPLVWEAIIVSTHAGVVGGLSALGMAKDARALLEQAEAIDPEALDGSVYTSLGSLYYKVPGWPLGFGDDDQAERYLKKALARNPTGIDPNYFYGDFLLDQGRDAEALEYLERALQAPDRPGREVADAGRRQEARDALEQASRKLARQG